MIGVTDGLRLGTLAAAFGLMGAMKLAGVDWERNLFRSWSRSDQAMRLTGVTEAGGALLLASPATRRLGAATLAAESLATLGEELRHRNYGLAAVRGALAVIALGAAMAPRRRARIA